jgi:5-histidylcysteine sulfoxide synthase
MKSKIIFPINQKIDTINLAKIEEKLPSYIDKNYSKYSIIDNKIISLPSFNINSGKEEYLKYFNNCWLLTEALFLSLKYKESFYQKPYHLLRHPLIFYYGHVASLYVNKMLVAGLINKTINKEFERIFETGVDEMTWDADTKDNEINWPNLEKVTFYRKEVYNLVTEIINKSDKLFSKEISDKNQLWSILMSFEHERIHLETSSVLIREMQIDQVRNPKYFLKPKHLQKENNFPRVKNDYPENELLLIKSKTANIGKRDLTTYGWDNEYGHDERKVDDFYVSKLLISNGEFFEFVKNDGYHNDKYWCKDGLAWRKFRNIYHPTFWVANGPKGSNLFKLRCCFEIVDMQWNYPVIVNHYEAKAFCRYKSEIESKNYRLPFEAEHKSLKIFEDDPIKNQLHGDFNFNLQNLSENAVNQNKQTENNLYDIHGNVWQWLEDDFHPLKGFKIHDYYKDFSTPCFDGKHKMIAGSSFFSTGNLASINSRYHFRPHFFQYAGFRIVNDCNNYREDNIKIEFETTNKKDGVQYIIFRENNELKVLEKERFNTKFN